MRQIFVFLLGLWVTLLSAQPVDAQRSAGVSAHHRSDHASAILLTNVVRINRPAVFTDHRLAGRVVPGKKLSYNASTEGQTASQPSPTTRPILSR